MLIQEADGDGGWLWDSYGLDNNILPFTHDFPRADIHEMLTPDLLHQVIKGTFKDHLVTWVGDYLALEHGEKRAGKILDDIDRRYVTFQAHWFYTVVDFLGHLLA
ncbi:hypothetical protein H1R20_g6506, partial [Candolleomyces eurysporus]